MKSFLLFSTITFISGGGIYGTPFDSSAGTPYWLYFLCALVLIYLIFRVYLSFEEDKYSITSFRKYPKLNLEMIQFNEIIESGHISLEVKNLDTNHIILQIISDDFNKKEGWIRITSKLCPIIMVKPEISLKTINIFSQMCRINGFKTIIVNVDSQEWMNVQRLKAIFKSNKFTSKLDFNKRIGVFQKTIL